MSTQKEIAIAYERLQDAAAHRAAVVSNPHTSLAHYRHAVDAVQQCRRYLTQVTHDYAEKQQAHDHDCDGRETGIRESVQPDESETSSADNWLYACVFGKRRGLERRRKKGRYAASSVDSTVVEFSSSKGHR